MVKRNIKKLFLFSVMFIEHGVINPKQFIAVNRRMIIFAKKSKMEAIKSPVIASFWPTLSELSVSAKLELAVLLLDSVREPKTLDSIDLDDEHEKNFRSLAGCWANDSGDDDVEEILKKSRGNKKGSRTIQSFD